MSYGFLERCQACCTDMPGFAMRSFEDEGVTYYVCLDVEACEARRQARARKPGLIEISYVMTQLNLLTDRVQALEERQKQKPKYGPGPY